MQNDDPENSGSGNGNTPSNEADEPKGSETPPYMAPDGREHILEVGDATDNIKKPQSGNAR